MVIDVRWKNVAINSANPTKKKLQEESECWTFFLLLDHLTNHPIWRYKNYWNSALIISHLTIHWPTHSNARHPLGTLDWIGFIRMEIPSFTHLEMPITYSTTGGLVWRSRTLWLRWCWAKKKKNVPHALSSRQHPKHNNNNNTNWSSVAHVRQVLRSKKPNCAANRHFSPVDLLECLAKPVIQRSNDANQKKINCVLPDNDIGKLVVFWQWKMRCRCAKSEGH